jgi:hypothetical protein
MDAHPAPLRRPTLRTVSTWLFGAAVVLFAMTAPVAAATKASELGLLRAILRLQELARNVAYILGPTLFLVGLVLYLFTTRNVRRIAKGNKLIWGGAILFGISLALDLVLNLIAWIVS